MIRMKPDGTFEFDTVDEAITFQARNTARENAAKEQELKVRERLEEALGVVPTNGIAKWNKLLSFVGRGNQHTFLRALRARPAGLSLEDAILAVGVDTGNALAGVIGGGLSKNIKAAGMEIDEVYIVDKANGHRIYRPGPLLTKYEVPA